MDVYGLVPGRTGSNEVHQPSVLLVQRGQSAQMNCSHDHGTGYYEMSWYQQLPGESMRLIVLTVPYSPPDFGGFSPDKFSATKIVLERGSFTVKNVEPGDNGVYFCCVSNHSDADSCRVVQKPDTHERA